jgi:hypothetical protein
MSDPIDFKRERARRARGGRTPKSPHRWVTIGILVAAVAYALLRAWQAIGTRGG